MKEIKLAVPQALLERLKKHPEIQWEIIAQSALEKYLEKIELTEKRASRSKLTLDDVEEISNHITAKSGEEHKKYLQALEE